MCDRRLSDYPKRHSSESPSMDTSAETTSVRVVYAWNDARKALTS